MTDILDLIDQATGCQQCGARLGESPANDFCSASCQQRWHEARCDLFAGYTSAEHGGFPFQPTRAGGPPVRDRPAPPGRRGFVGIAPEGAQEPTAWIPLHPNCRPVFQAILGPPGVTDGPPYTHTFTHGEPDEDDQVLVVPSFTITEQHGSDLQDGRSLLRGVYAPPGQRLRIEAGGVSVEEVVVVGLVPAGVLVASTADPLAPQSPVRAAAADLARWAGTTFAEALQCLTAAMRQAGAAAEDAAATLASMPPDPRIRALQARRNRNTGPQQRRRPPRTIRPRGCQ